MTKIVKGTDEIPQKFNDEVEQDVITKTIGEWATSMNIRLLDEKFYEDKNKYTIKQYQELVPRDVEVPLVNKLDGPTALEDFARGIIPEDFAKEYKKMKKLQQELEQTENTIKNKLIEMFQSIPELEKNSVSMDGLKFTYIAPTVRKSVDTKKLQEEHPEIYKQCLKESQVKAQIRTSVEF